MKTRVTTSAEVLEGYRAVAALYGHVPPLSHWRAWEYAAYHAYSLPGRVLDLGCGDGRYFRLVWPDSREVVGVDADPEVVRLARASGVYERVHNCLADQVPEPDASFDAVFANCSLEHMDRLGAVLAEVHRCLKPGGVLICSVVTNRFVEWAVLPRLVGLASDAATEAGLRRQFLELHHLVNPLTVAAWAQQMAGAGLLVEEHVPILPQYSSGFFLLMDSIWHVKQRAGGELGDVIHPFLARNQRFPAAFAQIVAGLMEMEMDALDCSGAIFLARKAG